VIALIIKALQNYGSALRRRVRRHWRYERARYGESGHRKIDRKSLQSRCLKVWWIFIDK